MALPRTLRAACHCKRSTLSFTVPTSSLPLPTHFCHCSTCRHTHGTLATIHAPIPAPTVDLASFTAYASSELVRRFFCSTCGAHMLDKCTKEGEEQWYVAASLVDAEETVWQFEEHLFVGGTGDGGLASLLQEIDGTKMKCYEGDGGDGDRQLGPSDLVHTKPEPNSPSQERAPFLAHCHCGGIKFHIQTPRSPSIFRASNYPSNLTPTDKSKWYALHDVCTSCRLVSGAAIVSWMFPLASHLKLDDGSAWPEDHLFGTGKAYESSEGVERVFCGRCGATVVYVSGEREVEGCVDVAVGLVEGAHKGALREDILEWRKGVAYEEDCEWSGVLESLKHGLGVEKRS